jgi:NAD(P)-dependent dehydrogenase (short-subunit alcohol dehydrogenase family)
VKAIVEKEGKIDVWINNAGIFYAIGPIWEVSAETWMQDVSVNLFGTFHCLQAVIPHMIEQGFGRIVNVTGGGTAGEFKYGSGYGVSKTAIARMTENAQAELQGTNVLVFAMGPGLNNTDMTRYQRASEAGQRYLAHIEQLFNNGKDVSPDKAPKLAWALANGRLDAYGGRIVSVSDDLEQLEKKAADLGANSRKLRISK